MTDDELLEAAAKAAGYDVKVGRWAVLVRGTDGPPSRPTWNPLEDDGDALRLAVKLKLSIMFGSAGLVQVSADDGGEDCTAFAMEPTIDDPAAATRRAIVMAAASLSQEKPHG